MQTFSLQSCTEHNLSTTANKLFVDQIAADHKFVRSLVDWAERGVAKRVADKIGAASSTINRHYNGKADTKLGRDTLDRLRAAYPDFPGWASRNEPVRTEVADFLDRPFEHKLGIAELKPIPVFGTAIAMKSFDPERHIELTEVDSGEVLDHIARPVSLARDAEAYGLTVIGDSMWPRFRPGRRVIVSPIAPVSIGDDVIVQLRGTEGDPDHRDRVTIVLIKELVRRNAAFIELRQFNPDVTFRIEMERVAKIHKVIGEVF